VAKANTPPAPAAPAGASPSGAPPAGSVSVTGTSVTSVAPPPASAPAATGGVQLAAVTPTGDPKADYDKSYSFITSGRYDLAETSFRSFLTAYPKSDLAANAQYFLGESLFAR